LTKNVFLGQQKLVEQRRREKERFSIISQFCHLASFTLRRPETHLKCGALITSIDVDVGSSHIAEMNQGKNDLNVHYCLSESYVGSVEEAVVPTLANFFDSMNIPVTFAVRGQLVEVENSILENILKSSVGHEIASHSYYHRVFTDLSKADAQNELEMSSLAFSKIGLSPKSFVFPRNGIDHLDLLSKFGFEVYRESGGLLKDGMYVRRNCNLYDVHPGLHLGYTYNPIFLKSIIDISAKRRLPLHIWFHPRDIYETRKLKLKNIEKVLFPIYNYAKEKEKEGTMKFETMCSIVNEIKKTE
jgi:peptidoglycan/xylan/chitin deacetylase (PgdA/CDA1 family)